MSQHRKRLKWLYEQLPEWEQRGWLTPEGASGLRGHYGSAEDGRYQQAAIIGFAVLAAALIGGGIVLLFAHNWDAISRPTRAVLSVLPLLATQVICCIALARRFHSAAWREGAAVANTSALAAAIGLVGQTYNIPGNLGAFMLSVALLSLPTAYLLKSRWNLVLYLGAVLSWRWMEDANAAFWILWALALPGARLAGATGGAGSRILTLSILIAAVIGLPIGEGGFWWGLILWALVAASVLGWSAAPSVHAILGRIPQFLAFATLAVILFIACDPGLWRSEIHYLGVIWPPFLILLALGALNATGIVAALRQRDWIAGAWAASGIALVMLRLGAYLLNQPSAGYVIANAIVLAVAGLTLWAAYQRRSLLQVNGGLAFLVLYLALRFLDGETSILARAAAFICLGLGLLLANLFLSRRLKRVDVS